MPQRKPAPADKVLDKALELAESEAWDTMRLHAVAEALNISLDEIRIHFPQKDDLAEAWFDRADRAVLVAPRTEEFLHLSPPERLQQVIMNWFDALAVHRRLTRQMLAYKLEFGHVHLQALGIMRISRTVQWFLEAACRDSTGLQRIMDESCLTAIYLASFTRWIIDDSPSQMDTRKFLGNSLTRWHDTGSRIHKIFCLPAARPETGVPGH